MKKLFAILFVFCLTLSTVAADRVTATITVTNIPAVSDTLVINATTRYWSNSVAALPAARILIGASIGASATNLWRQIATYPYTGMALDSFSSSNIIKLKGSPGQTVSGSISVGTWGTVVLSTNTDTAAVVIRVPQSVESNAVRTNSMTQLGADLGTYSQSAFVAGTTLLGNIIQTTGNQTAAGSKYFTGSTNGYRVGNAIIAPDGSANATLMEWADPTLPYEANSDNDILNMYSAKLNFPQSASIVTNTWFSTNVFGIGTFQSLIISNAPAITLTANFYAQRVAHTSLANGNNAGVVFTGVYNKIKAGPTAAFTINGIAGGADGRMLILDNSIAQNMTIANDSGVEPTAGNRIYTRTGADVSTTAEGSVMLVYDSDSSRWIVINLQP